MFTSNLFTIFTYAKKYDFNFKKKLSCHRENTITSVTDKIAETDLVNKKTLIRYYRNQSYTFEDVKCETRPYLRFKQSCFLYQYILLVNIH